MTPFILFLDLKIFFFGLPWMVKAALGGIIGDIRAVGDTAMSGNRLESLLLALDSRLHGCRARNPG
jgi:hypothetical protein